MNFEELTWLFSCGMRNRGLIRMNFDEAALLWKAGKASEGDVLEIGRRHGGSTVLLAAALADTGRNLVSVDRRMAVDEKIGEFLAQYPVELLTQDSGEPLERRFGLLFIDGDHSYDGVKRDTEVHWDALDKGGQIAFHDAVSGAGSLAAEGVEVYCDQLCKGGSVREVDCAGSVLLVEKVVSELTY